MSAEEFMVEGTLLRVLRLSRIFGGAPLAMNTVGDVTFVSISYAWAVYGWILTSSLNILMCYFHSVYGPGYVLTFLGPMNKSQIFLAMCFIQYVLLSVRVLLGSYSGTTRMRSLSLQLNEIHKVFIEFHKNSKRPEIKNVVPSILVPLITYMSIGLVSAVSFLTCIYCEGFNNKVFNIFMNYQNITAVLLEIQIILVNLNNAEALNILNLELKKLLLANAYKSLDCNKTVRRIGKYYLGIINITTQKNKYESNEIFLMFSSIVIYLVFSGYIFSNVLNNTMSPSFTFNLLIILVQCWVCLHMIIFFSSSCDQVERKVKEMRTILGELMYHVIDTGGEIPVDLDILYKQITMVYPVYSVLGIFDVKQSIFTKILSAWVTYTIILAQVKRKV